ncbi:MAG: bifunctional N-acetylglucosamine-1-phosphate uridyltransferase/glucosamine-1-phosphate acetyltransferase, partial [Phycisphaerae bacterium]
ARHHSFIGDAVIGKNVNIGAGAITANYDGKTIHKSQIGDDVYIGPGTILVAPIDVPGGYNLKAGSVVNASDIKKS